MCTFHIQFNNLQNLFICDKITTKEYGTLINYALIIPEVNNKWAKAKPSTITSHAVTRKATL